MNKESLSNRPFFTEFFRYHNNHSDQKSNRRREIKNRHRQRHNRSLQARRIGINRKIRYYNRSSLWLCQFFLRFRILRRNLLPIGGTDSGGEATAKYFREKPHINGSPNFPLSQSLQIRCVCVCGNSIIVNVEFNL